jgi:glycosyltransferase involved in cell wall biosynthesis
MKVGILINAIATDGAICHTDLCRQFAEMGHSGRIYAKGFQGIDDSIPKTEIKIDELKNPEWWRGEALDIAIFYSVGRFEPAILKLAREAGASVIMECDSDGYFSVRQDPLRFLTVTMWHPSYSYQTKAKILKAWLHSWLIEGKAQDKAVFDSFELADYLKIESEEPARILRDFLAKRDRSNLAKKIVVIPFAVRRSFTEGPIKVDRQDLIIAAGRLGAQQKDPFLLEEALRRYLDTPDPVPVELHVRGEAPNLERLAENNKKLQLFKNTPPKVLCGRLADAQVLLSTSRFESTPIQGLEALCQGCTLVASDRVPGYKSLIAGGAFGETFSGSSAADCVRALQQEIDRRRKGLRDSEKIAAEWRSRCSLETVSARLLSLSTRDQGGASKSH